MEAFALLLGRFVIYIFQTDASGKRTAVSKDCLLVGLMCGIERLGDKEVVSKSKMGVFDPHS